MEVDKRDEDESSSIPSTTDSDSCSDSSSAYDEDDDEVDEYFLKQDTLCPFCSETSSNPETIITTHIKTVHGIDFIKEFQERDFDCFDFIKLINFLRSCGRDGKVIETDKLFTESNQWKNDVQYMKPVLSEDPLLTFDIESYLEKQDEDGEKDHQAAAEDEGSQDSQSSNPYATQIQELKTTIESMKACMKNVMEGGNSFRPSDTSGKDTGSVITTKKHKKRRMKRRPSSSDTNQVYFSSYSHFGIHHEMLSDFVRTNAYRTAIEGHSKFKDSRVLDVGCGTGILSLFAASAGAKKVTAVDDSDIAFYAMMIVAENKVKEIDVVKTRLEKLPDPKGEEDKYDVIISEWMGYFLMYEGMLDTVITARDRFLKKDGVMLPNRSVIKLAALSDQSLYDKHVNFWDNVYGYSMSSLRSECITEPLITVVKGASLCSNEVEIIDIDCMTCTQESTRFMESDVSLRVTQSTLIHGIVGWFDCYFDNAKEGNASVILSTSPNTRETHWKQTVFLLKTPVAVTEGSDFTFKATISRPKHEERALKVDFVFSDQSRQEYVLL